MNNLEVVYCIQCSCVVPRTEAEVVFKTGFFKVGIPLAQCKSCKEQEKTQSSLYLPFEYTAEFAPINI
ncbi:hypothetical protein D3C73_821830 [compost metagenome]